MAFENGHVYYYEGELEGDRILWQDLIQHPNMKHLNTKGSLEIMKVCPKSPWILATGGKENDLQVWDVHTSTTQPLFKAKNVRSHL